MASKDFSAWRFILVVAAIFLGATIVAAIATGIFSAAGEGATPPMLALYLFQFSLACAAVWWWMAGRGGVRLRLGARWRDAAVVAGGMALFTAAGIAIEPLMELFPDHYLRELDEMIGKGVGMAVLTVAVAPVMEELLFRGLLLEGLLKRWSAAAAVAASAALFGAAHLPNFPQAVNAFVMASVMGYIYVLSGRRLVPVVLIHAANNAVAFVMLRLTGSQIADTRSLVGGDAGYWTLWAVCAAVFIVSMVVMVRAARNKTAENNV